MTKQTKMLVGVGLLGVATYLLWKSSQPKATANASGKILGKKSSIPNCSKGCSSDHKCISTGMVFDCIPKSLSSGAYGGGGGYQNNFVGKKRKKPRGGAYSTYGGGIGSYGK